MAQVGRRDPFQLTLLFSFFVVKAYTPLLILCGQAAEALKRLWSPSSLQYCPVTLLSSPTLQDPSVYTAQMKCILLSSRCCKAFSFVFEEVGITFISNTRDYDKRVNLRS